ncbi:MAG: hypothetical protein RL490_330, partial [Pseudomonadota bacterium]
MKMLKVSLLALAVAQMPAMAQAADAPPSAAEADRFIADAETTLQTYIEYASRVAWVNATYITDDTDALNARAGAEGTLLTVKLAKDAARFNATPGLSYDTRRKLDFL